MEQEKESEFLRLRSAIKQECVGCVSTKAVVDIEHAIRSCQVVSCPLRPVRPYQRIK